MAEASAQRGCVVAAWLGCAEPLSARSPAMVSVARSTDATVKCSTTVLAGSSSQTVTAPTSTCATSSTSDTSVQPTTPRSPMPVVRRCRIA